MIEEYRAVKGYEGLYEVSNYGNVKSLKRKGVLKDKILKCSKDSAGYLGAYLLKDGYGKRFATHQLVAIAFLNHTPNGNKIVVDHIDNNPRNNKLHNLQIITQRENTSKDKKAGSSKYPGVHWHKQANKWRATIMINGKTKSLGLFTNELQAANYYQYELQRL
jgi:hypothetical protein